MNTIIEKIRAEIERLKIEREGFRDAETESELSAFYNGQAMMLDEILDFLSDLEKECGEFPTTDEEMAKFLAAHPKVEVPEKYKTPDWMFEKSEKPTPAEGLEEEIKRYYKDMDGDCRYVQTARHFARWGAEHLK